MAVEDIGFIDCHGGGCGGLSFFKCNGFQGIMLIVDQLYGYGPYIYL